MKLLSSFKWASLTIALTTCETACNTSKCKKIFEASESYKKD